MSIRAASYVGSEIDRISSSIYRAARASSAGFRGRLLAAASCPSARFSSFFLC